MPQPQRIAIVGGGWAGMAAAVALQQQGHQVQVWEASRQWGGRARALDIPAPDGGHWTVDNGQHILIGAYQACLQLMRTVGVEATALQRLPDWTCPACAEPGIPGSFDSCWKCGALRAAEG